MQNLQRVSAPMHVDARDGAPRAADQKQPVALRAHDVVQGIQFFADMRLATPAPAFDRLQFERSKIGGDPPPDGAARNFRQFHGRAADVTDQTVGSGPAQQHALRGQPGLFLSVDDLNPEPGFAQHRVAEVGPVRGIPDGGGGDGGQLAEPHALGQPLKAVQRTQRAGPPFGVEVAGLRKTRAKRTHDLFVVEIGGRARRTVKHDKPDRVRSHIDDPHTRQRACRRIVEQGAAKQAVPGLWHVRFVHSCPRGAPGNLDGPAVPMRQSGRRGGLFAKAKAPARRPCPWSGWQMVRRAGCPRRPWRRTRPTGSCTRQASLSRRPLRR